MSGQRSSRIRLMDFALRGYLRGATLYRRSSIARELKHWQSQRDVILSAGRNGYSRPLRCLGLSPAEQQVVEQEHINRRKVKFGEIDQDGFFSFCFGALKGLPNATANEFRPRLKYRVDIVSVDGVVGVEKTFGDHRERFLNELSALHVLGKAGCNVPAVLDVDFDALSITTSFILGTVLKEALAQCGAPIHGRDTLNDPSYLALASKEQWLHKVHLGRKYIACVVDRDFVDSLMLQFARVHDCGFIVQDVKYGNIIVEKSTGKPYLFDFDLAWDCRRMPRLLFAAMCEKEMGKLSLHFPQELFASARVSALP